MLSIEDIYRNFGKNIFIYPTNHLIIKGASIDLTASKYAWSMKTKKSIYNSVQRKIVIPPNDTAIIFTNEVLYVTNKIAGTYHSKVSFTAEGLGHIGTSLDPEVIGPSKITIHNHNNKEFVINVNHTIVSVCFNKLDTPVAEKSQPDCQDFIASMTDYENYSDFQNYIDQNPWMTNARQLKLKIKRDPNYVTFKQSLIEENFRLHDIKTIAKILLRPFILSIFLVSVYVLLTLIDSSKSIDYVIATIFFLLPYLVNILNIGPHNSL